MRFYILCILSVVSYASTIGQRRLTTMTSPDGKIGAALILGEQGEVRYSISLNGLQIFEPAPMGLELDSAKLNKNFVLAGVQTQDIDEQYELPFGKTSHVRNHCREYRFDLVNLNGAHLRIDFRLFDDGVAFRYVLPHASVIKSEFTEILPHGNPQVYALPTNFGSPYEDQYITSRAKQLPQHKIFGLPMAFRFGHTAFVNFSEADLHDYPHSYLVADGEKLRFRYPELGAPALGVTKSPWRAFIVAGSQKEILESNLIANLSEPAKTKDTSWIHSGKVLFQWWNGYVIPGKTFDKPSDVLNTETYRYYVDFCAQHGIEYISLDGYEFEKAWYGGTVGYQGQDITRAIPEIDLEGVIQYAAAKGVGVRAWLHSEGLTDGNMEHVLSTYAKIGISGIMVDFAGDDTQQGSAHMEKVLQSALKHHLTVAYHGIAKPTGLSRTYPNYLTQEGVLGQEYNKWPGLNNTPDHEVNIAFVRQSVGPLDTHEGAFRPVPLAKFKDHPIAPNGIGTLARQLAMYVVYENEQPMLVDYPAAYEKHPEALNFITQVPVTWDETQMAAGDLDEKFISIARRHGSDWYIGSITGEKAKSYQLPLKFLGAGRFRLRAYSDSVESASDGESMFIGKDKLVTAQSVLTVNLAPAGGQAVSLTKVLE